MSKRIRYRDRPARLPPGVTVHAIIMTESFGVPRNLEGALIVEMPDGSLHKLTGAEMSEWNEALADFVTGWQLPQPE